MARATTPRDANLTEATIGIGPVRQRFV